MNSFFANVVQRARGKSDAKRSRVDVTDERRHEDSTVTGKMAFMTSMGETGMAKLSGLGDDSDSELYEEKTRRKLGHLASTSTSKQFNAGSSKKRCMERTAIPTEVIEVDSGESDKELSDWRHDWEPRQSVTSEFHVSRAYEKSNVPLVSSQAVSSSSALSMATPMGHNAIGTNGSEHDKLVWGPCAVTEAFIGMERIAGKWLRCEVRQRKPVSQQGTETLIVLTSDKNAKKTQQLKVEYSCVQQIIFYEGNGEYMQRYTQSRSLPQDSDDEDLNGPADPTCLPYLAIKTTNRESVTYKKGIPPLSYDPNKEKNANNLSTRSSQWILLLFDSKFKENLSKINFEDFRELFLQDEGGHTRLRRISPAQASLCHDVYLCKATDTSTTQSKHSHQSKIEDFATVSSRINDDTKGFGDGDKIRKRKKKIPDDDEYREFNPRGQRDESDPVVRRSQRTAQRKVRTSYATFSVDESLEDELAEYVDEFEHVLPGDQRMSQVILQYPEEDDAQDSVPICIGDVKRLRPGEFLNDNLINFYLKYSYNERMRAVCNQKRADGLNLNAFKPFEGTVHIFNTHFYTKLTEGDMDLEDITAARRRHRRVQRWTKAENLFEKDYILVPINLDLHWSLAVICYAGDLMSSDVKVTKSCGEEEGGDTTDDEGSTIVQEGGGKSRKGENRETDDTSEEDEAMPKGNYTRKDRRATVFDSKRTVAVQIRSPEKGYTAETSITIDDDSDDEICDAMTMSNGTQLPVEEGNRTPDPNVEVENGGRADESSSFSAQTNVGCRETGTLCNDNISTVASNENYSTSPIDAHGKTGQVKSDDKDIDDDENDVVVLDSNDDIFCSSTSTFTAKNNSLALDKSKRLPCILYLDSLRMHDHKRISKFLRSYLNCEYECRKSIDKEYEGKQSKVSTASTSVSEMPERMRTKILESTDQRGESAVNIFTEETLDARLLEVPKQRNSWDCGVFLLEYADQIMDKLPHITEYEFKHKKCKSDLNEKMFRLDHIKRRRSELKQIIMKLHDSYSGKERPHSLSCPPKKVVPPASSFSSSSISSSPYFQLSQLSSSSNQWLSRNEPRREVLRAAAEKRRKNGNITQPSLDSLQNIHRDNQGNGDYTDEDDDDEMNETSEINQINENHFSYSQQNSRHEDRGSPVTGSILESDEDKNDGEQREWVDKSYMM